MKQHSYAFYSGWLSNEYLRKERLEKELQSLDAMEPPELDISSAIYLKHLEQDSEEQDFDLLESKTSPDSPSNVKHGGPGKPSIPTNSIPTKQDYHPNGLYRTPSLVEDRERLLHEIDATERDLTGKVSGRNKYPNNLTFGNFLDYMVCPTLVYELEYPRTDKYSTLSSPDSVQKFFPQILPRSHFRARFKKTFPEWTLTQFHCFHSPPFHHLIPFNYPP